MSDQEINKEIALLCGWKPHYSGDGFGSHPVHAPSQMERMPDYCNDLNAMHEAEAHLLPIHDGSSDEYGLELYHIIAIDECTGPHEVCVWHATANQRARALVKVIRKQKG